MIPTVEKSVKNYVEWYFQSAQRLNFSRLYAVLWWYIVYTVFTVYTVYNGSIPWFHTFVYIYIAIYAYMRMFHAYLWMFPPHLLPHQLTHFHPERNPQRGGRREAPPPFGGGGAQRRSIYGWMCVGWWGSRCNGNIHKYTWNMRMYTYHSKFMWLWSSRWIR